MDACEWTHHHILHSIWYSTLYFIIFTCYVLSNSFGSLYFHLLASIALLYPLLSLSSIVLSLIFCHFLDLYYTILYSSLHFLCHPFTSSLHMSFIVSSHLLSSPLLSFPLPFSSTLLNIILIYAILFDRTSLTLCCFQFEIIEYRSSLTSERCN